MKKVSIIGLFCGETAVSNGQSVKTRIVTEELEKALAHDQVLRIDTYGWKKHPVKLLVDTALSVRRSENVIFLTDEGGIRVFPNLLRLANVSGKCRLHYYVVGGWLHSYLDKNKNAAKALKKLDVIYVEVPAMLQELKERGFTNGVLLNKFRRMTPAAVGDLQLRHEAPYRLCYFSRVMKEKGIEECIAAVVLANEQAGYHKFTLDIFGSVNEPYKETFADMAKQFPPYIRYGGIVDYQQSTQLLSSYFAMLFPTYYASEGYPNAIVDAFAAGLPVIATRWNYNADIIRHREDGILVDVGSVEQLAEAMESLAEHPETYGTMRKNCIARCREYLPENAIRKVLENLRS